MEMTTSSTINTLLLPPHILNSTPSWRYDNIEPNEETLHRVFGCELIQEAGILLRMSQAVMATGQHLLHRFYYRKSLKRFDVFTVSMGCFLLASKLEEKPKILREIIYVFHHMYNMRKGLKLKSLELGGMRYTAWKNEVIMIERHILKELGFSFYNYIEHPHKYLLYYIKVVDGSAEYAQRSWNYLNDACRLDLCLRHETRVIACAAMHLAAVDLAFPLPGGARLLAANSSSRGGGGGGDVDSCQWWRVFGVELSDIITVGQKILHLYELPKLTWLEPIGDVAYLSPEECALYDELPDPEREGAGPEITCEMGGGDLAGEETSVTECDEKKVNEDVMNSQEDQTRTQFDTRSRSRSNGAQSRRRESSPPSRHADSSKSVHKDKHSRNRSRSRERDRSRDGRRRRRERSNDRRRHSSRSRSRSADRERKGERRRRGRDRDGERGGDDRRGKEKGRERGSSRDGRNRKSSRESRSRSRSGSGLRRRHHRSARRQDDHTERSGKEPDRSQDEKDEEGTNDHGDEK